MKKQIGLCFFFPCIHGPVSIPPKKRIFVLFYFFSYAVLLCFIFFLMLFSLEVFCKIVNRLLVSNS